MTDVTQLISGSVSDRGLNESRPQNEDSFIELAHHGIFAVADGVGGAQAGEVASQMAVEILSEAFINAGEDADPEDTMRIALDRANEAIFQMSHDLPQLSSMATTIVAVHVANDIATIAHVGDSRVYRLDAAGKLFRETDDHSVVEEEVRAGRMTPEQALTHPSRNVISRALGADSTVEPDIKMVLVHPSTIFLLCSDGITRHIPDNELESVLASDLDPDETCALLKEICFERGAEDNLTAVIVKFPAAPVKESVQEDADDEQPTLAGIRVSRDSISDELVIEDLPPPRSAPVTDGDNILELENDTAEFAAELVRESTPTQFQDDEDEAYLMEETVEIEQAAPIAIVTEEPLPTPSPEPDPRPSPVSYHYEDQSGTSGGLGKLASMIGMLILGGIIGLAAGYFLLEKPQPVTEIPPVLEQKSSNVPLTSFEDTRRLVDEDPVKYLNANAASPQEADDYFWIGRALLLTGKPVEARRAYEEAKSRLPGPEPLNSRVMASEIAMALAILDSPQALQSLTKGLAANGSTSAPANNVPEGENR